MMDYATLDDNTLINLLFTEDDRLPRQAVDELVRRGTCMIEPLSNIVSEKVRWKKDRPEIWAPIHAVYILGAIGTQEVIAPLMAAIKWSDKYNIDWVYDTLPSIFGKIGTPALECLLQFAANKKLGWFVRSVALSGLAAITLKNPEVAEDVFFTIHSYFTNIREDMEFRVQAVNIVLDFVLTEYKESLIAFCQEEMRYREKTPMPMVSYDEQDVEMLYFENKKQTAFYTQNWLSFYDKEQIRQRQERWKKELDAYPKLNKRTYEEIEVEEAVKKDVEEVLEPIVNNMPKVGRNEPCPCGSGKKYKKCCMGNEIIQRRV